MIAPILTRVPSGSLHPVAKLEKIGVQAGFRRSCLRAPVVAPNDVRRQGHQNRFGAPARLQSKQRAPVVDQIELDIATAPISLEIALAFSVRELPAALGDRHPGFDEMIAYASKQAETLIEAPFGEIIEEDPADTARFLPMLEIEILIAPLLESWIVLRVKGVQ